MRRLRPPKIATNYVILSSAELVSKIASALAFAYLARVLGPESYGYLEFSLAILFFLTLLVDSGLSHYGAREIAKDVTRAPQLITSITFLRFVLSLVAIAILVVISRWIDQPAEVKQLLLLFSATLVGLPWLILWVFQGQDKMQYVALASLLRWSAFSAGVFLLVRGLPQLWMVPFIEAAAILLAAAFLLVSLRLTLGLPVLRPDRSLAIQAIRKAFPIGGSELVWAVKVYSATIVLGFLVRGAEVGWFGSAHRIVISLHTFVWLYFYNLFPSIARTTHQPLDALQRLMRVSFQITAWSAVFLGVTGTAFAQPAIELLYGQDYQQAVLAFQVMIWLIPLAMLSGNYRYILIGYDKQSYEFLCNAAGAVLSLALNLILIPSIGFMGAVWALVLSEIVIIALAYYFVRREVVQIPLFSHLGWPVVAGVVLVGALYLVMPINVWVAVMTALVVYPLILILAQPELLSRMRTYLARDRVV